MEVPDEFLQEFDQAIQARYKTRAEAIRAAMDLLLEKLRGET